MSRNDHQGKTMLKTFALILVAAFALPMAVSRADDESRINRKVLKATTNDPVWIHKVSRAKDCGKGDGGSDLQAEDLAAGQKELEAAGIRVLTNEQNVSEERKAGILRNCGDSGNFVSCYLVFGDAAKKAADLGYRTGGRCGKQFKKRVH